jgi:hypothetical protein
MQLGRQFSGKKRAVEFSTPVNLIQPKLSLNLNRLCNPCGLTSVQDERVKGKSAQLQMAVVCAGGGFVVRRAGNFVDEPRRETGTAGT